MALTVEDGTGLADADTYAALATASDYATARGRASTYAALASFLTLMSRSRARACARS